jgi:hypothetical protein
MRLGRTRESYVNRFAWPCKLIFFLLAGPKQDLGEVEKGTLREVPWPYELISCLLVGANATCAISRKRYSRGRTTLH